MFINSSSALENVLKNWKTSNYGPPYFITKDGEAMCEYCVRANLDLICSNIDNGSDPQWEVVAYDMNWEANDLYCSHCNEKIEPEYEND